MASSSGITSPNKLGFPRHPLIRTNCTYLKKFYKIKCQMLHQGWGNPRHEHRLGDQVNDSNPLKGFLVDEKLVVTQECVPEGHLYPGQHAKQRVQQGEGGGFTTPCGPHESPSGILGPALLSSAQKRCGPLRVGPEDAMKMIRGLEPCDDRLRELGLLSLKKEKALE